MDRVSNHEGFSLADIKKVQELTKRFPASFENRVG